MCIVPSFMLLKWYYADEFSGSRIRDVAELEAKYGIKDPQMLKVAGVILFLVIINFFLHPITHIAVSWIALVGAVIMLLATDRHELEEPLHHVEWTTLLFFAGLFVLVHSLQYWVSSLSSVNMLSVLSPSLVATQVTGKPFV